MLTSVHLRGTGKTALFAAAVGVVSGLLYRRRVATRSTAPSEKSPLDRLRQHKFAFAARAPSSKQSKALIETLEAHGFKLLSEEGKSLPEGMLFLFGAFCEGSGINLWFSLFANVLGAGSLQSPAIF